MAVLAEIQGFLRTNLAAQVERRGAPQPLRAVQVDRINRSRAWTSIAIRYLFDGDTWTLDLPEDHYAEWQMPLLDTALLVQLYRFAYHAQHGSWESYIPRDGDGDGYRYIVAEPMQPYPTGIEPVMQEYRHTYDPFYARDPDGRELTNDLEYLDHFVHHMARSEGYIRHSDELARFIRNRRAFRPARRDDHDVAPQRAVRNDMADALTYAHLRQQNRMQFHDNYIVQTHYGIRRTDFVNMGDAPMVRSRDAEARGMKLLHDHLTPEQKESLETKHYFDITSQSGKPFRIETGNSYNIHQLAYPGGPTVAKYCFQPTGNLVTGDVMLTQKLSLETREADALKVANRHPVEPPPGSRRRQSLFSSLFGYGEE